MTYNVFSKTLNPAQSNAAEMWTTKVADVRKPLAFGMRCYRVRGEYV